MVRRIQKSILVAFPINKQRLLRIFHLTRDETESYSIIVNDHVIMFHNMGRSRDISTSKRSEFSSLRKDGVYFPFIWFPNIYIFIYIYIYIYK